MRFLSDEVGLARLVEQLARNMRRLAAVTAERADLIDQVARVTGAQGAALRAVVALVQVLDENFVELELTPPAVHLEDARVFLERRIVDRNLVRDAAQERFVGELLRVEIRREYRQHVERNLEFLAGVQRQVVDAALQRNNPPVEQVVGPHALTSEVVDEKDPAVGLQLKRRLVE